VMDYSIVKRFISGRPGFVKSTRRRTGLPDRESPVVAG
jgi:hypothetical protein